MTKILGALARGVFEYKGKLYFGDNYANQDTLVRFVKDGNIIPSDVRQVIEISSLEKNLSEFERHKRHLLRFAFALNKYAEASCHAKIFSQTIYYLDETVFILNLAYKLRDDQASLAQATSKLFSRLGAVGADKRHSPMKELKDWTLKQYQVGNWKAKKESANKAAHDLKERVLAQGKIIHPELAVLSEQNAQRTIAEWIRKSA